MRKGLKLRVAEADVVLEEHRPVVGEDAAEVEDPVVLDPPRGECLYRPRGPVEGDLSDLRLPRMRAFGRHAAGVGPGVARKKPLVVPRRTEPDERTRAARNADEGRELFARNERLGVGRPSPGAQTLGRARGIGLVGADEDALSAG